MNGRISVSGKILGSVLAVIVGANLGTSVKVAADIAAIKANRFTSQDGLAVWKAIGEVEKKVAAMPPRELVREVQEIKTLLMTMDRRLSRVENTIERLDRDNKS